MDDDRNIARPDIVEAILDGRQPPEMTLAALMQPFPVAWGEQADQSAKTTTPSGSSSALPRQAE